MYMQFRLRMSHSSEHDTISQQVSYLLYGAHIRIYSTYFATHDDVNIV